MAPSTTRRGEETLDSPSWQSSPATPGGQRQAPVAGSHVPPFWHRQLWLQLLPKVPAGQAGEGEGDDAQPGCSLAGLHALHIQSRGQSCHSLWLQSTPVQPGGQRQPLPSAVQVAPFLQSSQVRLQSGPNVCSRQTATRGTAGENLPQAAAASWGVWAEKPLCGGCSRAERRKGTQHTPGVFTKQINPACMVIPEEFQAKHGTDRCCKMPTEFL